MGSRIEIYAYSVELDRWLDPLVYLGFLQVPHEVLKTEEVYSVARVRDLQDNGRHDVAPVDEC